ncbi:pentapeptide repeat-containing protein [Mycoavidus sp. B2-EB]|uniref:WD40 repeat domain-containing protein n=1 Tax=Mycoavidus sp. B2-EB TaxID=2651972 RepID=UPI001623A0CD|nr:pentapeptide repeat-containing protein [Mycoavidus sp. B2-EB]BBO60009.1 hypothetical protein MPB2EB_1144 [Mycoavidus sp. B2-EB]
MLGINNGGVYHMANKFLPFALIPPRAGTQEKAVENLALEAMPPLSEEPAQMTHRRGQGSPKAKLDSLPFEILEDIIKYLDTQSRERLFEALTLESKKGFLETFMSWLPYSQSAVLSETKPENLFWRRIPPKYQKIQAQSNLCLQTYALNRIKELSCLGKLDRIVEGHRLFDLIHLISSPVIWDLFKQEIHAKPKLEKLWNWVESWGGSERTFAKGDRVSASNAQQKSDLEQALLNWIERSKIEEVQQMAARALTLLTKAEVDLSEHDFNKIRAPGADLSDGQFNNTRFKGADLSYANFYGASLKGADLREANLAQLNFWRLPTVWVGSLVHDCCYSPDGYWLAVSTDEGQIGLYQARALKLAHTLNGHSAAVTHLNFSSDSKFLASGGKDHKVMVWDIEKKALLRERVEHNASITNIKFLSNSELLASGSADGTLVLHNLQSGALRRIQHPIGGTILALETLPNNGFLVSWDGAQEVLRWDGGTQEAACFCRNTEEIQSIKVSSDGKLLALGVFNTVELWSLEKQKKLGVFGGHHDRVNALEFSPDDEFLASVSDDETVRLWNVRSVIASGSDFWVSASENGPPMLALKKEESIVSPHSQTISPDGEPLASASGVFRMCGRLSADSYVQLKGYRKGAWGMSFAPDGKVLALSGNQEVVLWNVSGWREGSYSDLYLSQAEPSVTGMGIKDAKGLDSINKHFLQCKGVTENPLSAERSAQCI